MTVEIYFCSVCENKQFHGQRLYRLRAHLSRKRHCKGHLSSHFFIEKIPKYLKICKKYLKKSLEHET